MTHLTDAEIVDLIDHALAPDRIKHAASCATCSARAEMARDALMRVDEVDVPEPSPLFWEHFSSRVRDGIAGEMPSSSWQLFMQRPAIAWTLTAALLLVVSSAVWWSSRPSTIDRPAATIAAVPPEASRTSPGVDDALDTESIDADVAWGLVRTVADDVSWDDTVDAGLGAAPGSVERAMGSLTSAERAELIALLASETKKPGV
jgi:hypothetical protein